MDDWYAPAYRTAFLILLDRHEAERAVHEAFLRAWRMRAAAPAGPEARAWVLRAVVNACGRRLRSADTHPADEAALGRPPFGRLARLDPVVRPSLALRVGAGLDRTAIAEVTHRRPEVVERDLAGALSQWTETPLTRDGES